MPPRKPLSKSQQEIDAMTPTLEDALRQIDSVTRQSLAELQLLLRKPPDPVLMTMCAVLVLLGREPCWDEARRILSDSSLIGQIKEYDKDNIPPEALKKLEKYIKAPTYQPAQVAKCSSAAYPLCLWTFAIFAHGRTLVPRFAIQISSLPLDPEGMKLICTNIGGEELVAMDIEDPSAFSLTKVRDDLFRRNLLPNESEVQFLRGGELVPRSDELTSLLELFSN